MKIQLGHASSYPICNLYKLFQLIGRMEMIHETFPYIYLRLTLPPGSINPWYPPLKNNIPRVGPSKFLPSATMYLRWLVNSNVYVIVFTYIIYLILY